MSKLSIFENSTFGNIRVSEQENGEPLFCLLDVARALGYANPAKAVIDHCGKRFTILETPTYNQHGYEVMQNIKFGRETEVYRLVFGSKLPNAVKFQDWVYEEVLPSIRKTGSYGINSSEFILNESALSQIEAIVRKAMRDEKEMKMLDSKKVDVNKSVETWWISKTWSVDRMHISDLYAIYCNETKGYVVKKSTFSVILKKFGVEYRANLKINNINKSGFILSPSKRTTPPQPTNTTTEHEKAS